MGYVFPDNSNAYQGKVSLSYYKGWVNGSIEHKDKVAKISPLERNIFSISLLKEKPKFGCGNRVPPEQTTDDSVDAETINSGDTGLDTNIGEVSSGTTGGIDSPSLNLGDTVSTQGGE